MTIPTDFPAFIDSTFRKEFDSCNLAGYYSHFRKIVPVGGNIHFHFGGCFAKGLEHMRLAFYGEGLSVQDALAAGAKAIILEWGDFPPVEKVPNKTLESCLDALYSYVEEYTLGEDSITPLMIDGKPAVEFTFALPIPNVLFPEEGSVLLHPQTGEPMLYTGRTDMLGNYGKAVFVDDEKTSGSLGASWAKQWKLSSQVTGYFWAVKQFGFEVQGVLIRGVGILKNSITHLEVIEYRPRWMVDRWLRQLNKDFYTAVESWKNNDWEMSLDTACSNYGGCDYLGLCEVEHPEDWIDTHYEKRDWDPLAK